MTPLRVSKLSVLVVDTSVLAPIVADGETGGEQHRQRIRGERLFGPGVKASPIAAPNGAVCITRDTVGHMSEVSIRELRNHGGDVVDRVSSGEHVIITRAGRPVAELRPLPRTSPDPQALLERWRHLPHVDPAVFRAGLDDVVDSSL